MPIAYTMTKNIGTGDGSLVQARWALLTATPDGDPIEYPENADITWVVTNANWGGATLKIQGSADGSTWVTTGLSNAAGGSEASATGDKVFTTLERPRFVRPILTTVGVASTPIVTALMRRSNPLRT